MFTVKVSPLKVRSSRLEISTSMGLGRERNVGFTLGRE